MKKQFFTGICLLAASILAAQDEVNLKDLEIPNAPAFILLDEAPTSIDRPATSKAFALGLLNSLDNNTLLPKNYAAELTPFWYFKHKNMTPLKYIGIDSSNFGNRVLNNASKASISLAFIGKPGNDSLVPVHHFSIGVRANLISIWTKGDRDDITKRYNEAVKQLKSYTELQNNRNSIIGVPTGNDSLDAIARSRYESLRAEQLSILDTIKSPLSEDLIRKPVFALDIAAGYNEFFLDNDFSQNHFGRLGVWLTANYSRNFGDGYYLNIYAAGKYLKTGTQQENGEYVRKEFFDAGLKVEFECKRLSASYEWLQRMNPDGNTTRSNGTLKYKISDKLYLTGAFGKNFGDNDNLISLLGINWGFSTGEEKTVLK